MAASIGLATARAVAAVAVLTALVAADPASAVPVSAVPAPGVAAPAGLAGVARPAAAGLTDGARPAVAGPAAARRAVAVPAAEAPSEVFIELNPSTVEAGAWVGIRASCPDNGKAATVRSDAFGRTTVEPQAGFLVRSVRIADSQDPRSFTVRLTCPGGENATATLHVVARTRPSRGPATGFGGAAGDGGSGGPLILGGLLTLTAGLALGLVTLRRRRAAG
jgi:hypothetical protein